MPKSPRGSKARAVRSVKRAQKIIRKFDKQEQAQRKKQGHSRGTLSSKRIRNVFHEAYTDKGVSVKFKKRSAKKK